jgi:hypothetical protein
MSDQRVCDDLVREVRASVDLAAYTVKTSRRTWTSVVDGRNRNAGHAEQTDVCSSTFSSQTYKHFNAALPSYLATV